MHKGDQHAAPLAGVLADEGGTGVIHRTILELGYHRVLTLLTTRPQQCRMWAVGTMYCMVNNNGDSCSNIPIRGGFELLEHLGKLRMGAARVYNGG